MINFIYGLYENEEEIKYVGKTNNINKRLKEHIKDSKKNITPKQKWIKSVLDSGSNIKIKILEEVGEFWEKEEIKYISSFSDLTNLSKGGFGGKGYTYNITYNDCKIYVQQNFDIKSKNEWYNIMDIIPSFIPKNPRESYLNRGWISWGDFLGTKKIQDNKIINIYISYEEAKKWIKQNLSAKTEKEWKNNIINLPIFIPNRPDRFYKNRGWNSWGDFLGTGRIANQYKKFVSYEESSLFGKINDIKSQSQWHKLTLPNNIPSNPDKEYKKSWKGWGIFLGTGKIQDNKIAKTYISYGEAKKWIKQNLSIKTQREWKFLVKNKNIEKIPNHPELFYKNKGWKGWKDFLSK